MLREGDNFMMKRSQLSRLNRQLLVCTAAVFAMAGSVMAQSTGTAKKAATDEGGYSTWDVTPFFGWQWFQAFQGNNLRNYSNRFQSGWLFGERINADFSPKMSFEGSMTLGSNRLDLRPFGQ